MRQVFAIFIKPLRAVRGNRDFFPPAFFVANRDKLLIL
ncbi:hypothetical protein LTSEALA_4598 [Salmonella enterica subsp. enterica serovar Alachua str. R6-377]|uniref:Uncharacterized protein n=1 Tax=Salmonella enterica subsp. enterica serovar Alachua str. R6-377 TaxID=913241 RepID=G5LTW4_SALET|nr:hypothetical protein LTSEALA_4598 [Salmonella enterica subsp. enterica serovar Alachua str. R6-377]